MTTFFLTAFWTPTFHTFFVICMVLGPKRGSKGTTLLRKNCSIFDRFPQSGQSEPRGGPRPPKKHQNGAPGHQNGPQVIPKFKFCANLGQPNTQSCTRSSWEPKSLHVPFGCVVSVTCWCKTRRRGFQGG